MTLTLLILDEWGYLPLHQEGARLIFDIISSCYETKSIIITTNIEFSKWKGFPFDEKLTVAIIDRLVHHSHMLIFTVKKLQNDAFINGVKRLVLVIPLLIAKGCILLLPNTSFLFLSHF